MLFQIKLVFCKRLNKKDSASNGQTDKVKCNFCRQSCQVGSAALCVLYKGEKNSRSVFKYDFNIININSTTEIKDQFVEKHGDKMKGKEGNWRHFQKFISSGWIAPSHKSSTDVCVVILLEKCPCQGPIEQSLSANCNKVTDWKRIQSKGRSRWLSEIIRIDCEKQN